jgi:hypothetical protein
MRKKRRKKKRVKPRKPRNFLAISAWFRKAGAMRNKKKERLKKLGRKKVDRDE